MKRNLLFVLCIFLCLSMLSSCVGNGDADDKLDNEEMTIILYNWQSYDIIYPSNFDETYAKAVADFASAIDEACGFRLRAESDFVIPDEEIPSDTLEILVGHTNRKESAEVALTLAEDEFTVRLTGDRLVIIGGSDKATVAALDYVKTELLKEDGIYYPAKGDFMKKAEFPSITISGRDISELEILYDDSNTAFGAQIARDLNALISDKLQIKLSFCKLSDRTSDNAIIFTENDGLEDCNYRISERDGDLYVEYDCSANAYLAIKALKEIFEAERAVVIPADYVNARSAPTYKVIMLGASNIAVGDTYQTIDTYFQAQYGDVSIEFTNAGRAGGTISSALRDYNGKFKTRIEREVYSQNPDAVIMSFVFNALGTSGIKTVCSDKEKSIERIWNGATGAEVDVSTLFDENGEFIGVNEMRALYPRAFTAEGRVSFKTVKYETQEDFDRAYTDVEKTAIVKYQVDKTFSIDFDNRENNLTQYTKFIYDLSSLVDDMLSRGIEVIIPTPVDYDEQLNNATSTSERIIGLKYVWADVDAFTKDVLAKKDGVTVVDFYAAQLELKGQLQEDGKDGSLMPRDRKHFYGMEGPYASGTAFMTDVIGKSLVCGNEADEKNTLMTDYVARVTVSGEAVSADNADVGNLTVTENGVSFSYKPHGVSIARIDTLMKVREALGAAKYEDTARFAENPNKEIFKIEGLDPNATYSIRIGKSTLKSTYTGALLAEGVDISLDAKNPSASIAQRIVDQLYTKRTYIAKLRTMSYVRETQLFAMGIDDSVAPRDEIFAAVDQIIASYPEGNYTRSTASSYKEYYDNQDEFYSNIALCDYNVKKLLDFDAYEVVIEKLN